MTRTLGISLLASAVALALASAPTDAAKNTVSGTHATLYRASITADALKPAECASLPLTTIVTGSGTIVGPSTHSLILGGPGADNIKGNSGGDCILAGGGDDFIDGGKGTTICDGGAGNNTYKHCPTQLP